MIIKESKPKKNNELNLATMHGVLFVSNYELFYVIVLFNTDPLMFFYKSY